MGNSIMGFNNIKLTELGIDNTNTILLRYLLDVTTFNEINKFYYDSDNKIYSKVMYSQIKSDLDILNLSDNDLDTAIAEYVSLGLIQLYTESEITDEDNYVCFTLTDKYTDLFKWG